ncbi:hypothetical protein BGX28_002334, partial [Mortierella sp. GBA30]
DCALQAQTAVPETDTSGLQQSASAVPAAPAASNALATAAIPAISVSPAAPRMTPETQIVTVLP